MFFRIYQKKSYDDITPCYTNIKYIEAQNKELIEQFLQYSITYKNIYTYDLGYTSSESSYDIVDREDIPIDEIIYELTQEVLNNVVQLSTDITNLIVKRHQLKTQLKNISTELSTKYKEIRNINVEAYLE